MAALVAWFDGEFEHAADYSGKAWPVLERTQHTAGMAMARFIQGSIAGSRGAGGQWGIAYAIVALGGHALDQADYERAESLSTRRVCPCSGILTTLQESLVP